MGYGMGSTLARMSPRVHKGHKSAYLYAHKKKSLKTSLVFQTPLVPLSVERPAASAHWRLSPHATSRHGAPAQRVLWYPPSVLPRARYGTCYRVPLSATGCHLGGCYSSCRECTNCARWVLFLACHGGDTSASRAP